VQVPPPDFQARCDIFRIYTRTMDTDVDVVDLAEETLHYTGADIKNVCREAAMHAIRRDMEHPTVVGLF
jgi:transitional endoplasmic reticulum ATPase